jgi:hypothetical protein
LEDKRQSTLAKASADKEGKRQKEGRDGAGFASRSLGEGLVTGAG